MIRKIFSAVGKLTLYEVTGLSYDEALIELSGKKLTLPSRKDLAYLLTDHHKEFFRLYSRCSGFYLAENALYGREGIILTSSKKSPLQDLDKAEDASIAHENLREYTINATEYQIRLREARLEQEKPIGKENPKYRPVEKRSLFLLDRFGKQDVDLRTLNNQLLQWFFGDNLRYVLRNLRKPLKRKVPIRFLEEDRVIGRPPFVRPLAIGFPEEDTENKRLAILGNTMALDQQMTLWAVEPY